MSVRGGRDGCVVGKGLWGRLDNLIQEKNEEACTIIEVRPEGYIDGPGSDITLNRQDMRSKFRYTTLYAILLGKEEIIWTIKR